MKQHPRTTIVDVAGTKLAVALLNIRREHKLTDLECIGILVREIQLAHKYAMRMERHGNYEKPSEEA